MKPAILFILVFFLSSTIGRMYAQHHYSYIDNKVASLSAPSPDSLARLLTKDLGTDVEKVRAIFSWIAQNISYNTGIFSFARNHRTQPILQEAEDTMVNWASGYEMTARRVMKNRVAICDGYAKLFHTLCEYSGIPSEIILGFARSGYERESKFRTNHSWNAVRIDGKWQLVDVTWGSGYVNSGSQYVAQMDEKYFLADPHQFFYDHHPEDLSWSLLPAPLDRGEYGRSPYRLKNFIKYNINSHFPGKGIIEAGAEDTIRVEVDLKSLEKASNVSSDPFFDSSFMSRTTNAVFLEPEKTTGNKLLYRLIAPGHDLKWIYIIFNKDLILRYRVIIRKDLAGRNATPYQH